MQTPRPDEQVYAFDWSHQVPEGEWALYRKVLGGLLEQNDRLETSKVPGLGDIPGVGVLFRSTRRERGRGATLR